jgi:carbon storage regulator CsrA
MLVLTRRVRDAIQIDVNGEIITIMLLSTECGRDGGRARIGIDAPKHFKIFRQELIDRQNADKDARSLP